MSKQTSGPYILIVGDVMLDRYWFGEVNRISPEAPVPVVLINRNEERLGGAANVARNVAALGADCSLMGIVGDDEAGMIVESLLNEAVEYVYEPVTDEEMQHVFHYMEKSVSQLEQLLKNTNSAEIPPKNAV